MRPRQLPKIRDQIRRHLLNPDLPLRGKLGAGFTDELDVVASHLDAADLYWVAPDMSALAMSAGAQLTATRWATADRPSPCGLIIFDGGLGMITTSGGVDVPIDACSWGPHPDGCAVWTWVARSRMADAAAARGAQFAVEQVPALVPICGFAVPITDEPLPVAAIETEAPSSVVAALAAAWLLMDQPQLVDRTEQRPDSSVRRAYARVGREDPLVTIIDLRRQYVPQDEPSADNGDGRRFRHRWVVSGHWRQQPYGPERALRRPTWIPAYVKGPEGAPLLATERVNVWRR